MWLFTKSGFYSAVQHYDNPDIIHVRARFKGDLERLWNRYLEGEPKVIHTPRNDYPYRMDITRTNWAIILREEAEKIDYENFKDAAHDGTSRDAAYMGCWSALRRSQD